MDLIRGTPAWIIGRLLLFVVLSIIIFLDLVRAPKLGGLANFKDYPELELMSASADALKSMKKPDQVSALPFRTKGVLDALLKPFGL